MESLDINQKGQNELNIENEEVRKRYEEDKQKLELARKEKSLLEGLQLKTQEYKLQEAREFERISREFRDKLKTINETEKSSKDILLVMITGGLNMIPALLKDLQKMNDYANDFKTQMNNLKKQIENNEEKLNYDFIKETIVTKNAFERVKREQAKATPEAIKENTKEDLKATTQIETQINFMTDKYPLMQFDLMQGGKDIRNTDLANEYLILFYERLRNHEEIKKQKVQEYQERKEREKKNEEVIKQTHNFSNNLSEFDKNLNESFEELNEQLETIVNKKHTQSQVNKFSKEISENKNENVHEQKNVKKRKQ